MKQGNRKSISVFLWLILSCVFHIVLFRGKLDMNTPIVLRLFFVILAVVITLPLHEIIHCIFMKLFGLRGARIEIAKDPLGLPSLRAVAQGEVWGWKQIVIFLAPFMLLTVVPDLLFFLSDKVHFLFFIIAMCNAAGCCFDVAEVARDINKSRIEGRK